MLTKHKEIFSLISEGIYYFLSRPRRFGKSLLVSTLKEIFSGNRGLFKGLYIYDKIAWKKHPVIQLDFSTIPHGSSQILEKALFNILDDHSKVYDIKLEQEFLEERFLELIRKLSEKEKVVILIDEYDKPILDCITDIEKARANREILRSFYAVLKGVDPYLRFVFLTGVSKFSRVSIFSGLNNLRDITISLDFATIAGITQEELEQYFREYFDLLSGELDLNRDELIENIKHWYNGYSWDGINKVYNPTSLLTLFIEKIFNNYWFTTGTPAFLIETIKKRKISVGDIENRVIDSSIMENFDIDNLEVSSLLFQTGYLTISEVIKKGLIRLYRLEYPNFEVKESFLKYLLASFTDQETTTIQPLYMEMLDYLAAKNTEQFKKSLVQLFSRIPYTLHLPYESYYHSLCYMILALMGARIDLEVLSDKGRVDAVLELKSLIYIIEFMMGKAGNALKQIREKRYWEPYIGRGKELYLLGAGGFGEKNIEVLVEKADKGNL